MYLIFDTETTGFIKGPDASPHHVELFPHVIQLAFVLLDEQFNEIESFCELIKPDGWNIPNQKFWIENGYSTETNEKNGIPMFDALVRFCDAIDRSTTIIAHNLTFDHKIMSAEMFRFKIGPNKKPANKICTMKQSVNFCKIPNSNRGGFKYPKLIELHEKLFGCGFENSHDAMADVYATIRCFVELRNRNVL
jgi:DNA polymerase III epsilon subunit-like protein